MYKIRYKKADQVREYYLELEKLIDQYKDMIIEKYKNIKKLLMILTNNKFGAIFQKIIKKHWMNNKLSTHKNFSIL